LCGRTSDSPRRVDNASATLVELSAAIAAGARDRWPEIMRAVQQHAGPTAGEEAILQSYLFLGFPAALQALSVWRDEHPLSTEVEPVAPAAWRERGEAVCAQVYGGQYERLRENVTALHPNMEQWMLTEGYGKVLARPGLALRTRELCIIALLAVQDAPRQLYSHIRGALNCGATQLDVREALGITAEFSTPDRAEQALQVYAAVLARRG